MYEHIVNFVKESTKVFDESHDVHHAKAVYENACDIANHDYPSYNDNILMFASLMHDVCDHKYDVSVSKEERDEFINTHLSRNEAQIVIDIIENISYSQETKGKRKQLSYPYSIYQDIVSDADKLEALGEVGITRCELFTLERGGVVPRDVIIHCHEKLLRLKDHFIRTVRGKQLATPLHQVIVEYCEKHQKFEMETN